MYRRRAFQHRYLIGIIAWAIGTTISVLIVVNL
jgi:hypothetical protein